MSRVRVWVWTSFKDSLDLNDGGIEYSVYQQEQCPTTGRLHWQGVTRFKNARQLGGVKRWLGDPQAHCEPCKKEHEAIKYCQKEETRIGQATILGHIQETLEPGWWQKLTINQLWEQHPEWMLKHYNGVQAYRRSLNKSQTERQNIKVFVFYGTPGTGKSYSARQFKPYFAKASGNWWDGYCGEETVIFDDFYGANEKYTDILRWCSELPISVPIKGSMVPLEATTFIFTSNSHPSLWWPGLLDKSAFQRRVTRIYQCFIEKFVKQVW
ncbi:replication-associated protein [Pacific flying fox faeces associated circular DNA virus-10]|nr:replication-associated protein [Pacific flying fox faeces associated circular DNA virus-10]